MNDERLKLEAQLIALHLEIEKIKRVLREKKACAGEVGNGWLTRIKEVNNEQE